MFRSERTIIFALAVLLGLAAFSASHADDGEGSVVLLSPSSFVAGTRTTVAFEFTVGESGIPVGGGIALGLHHAAHWEPPQTSAPARPAYATVTCGTPDNFELAWHNWAPKGAFSDPTPSGDSDNIHHQVLMARVMQTPLKPGEKVAFTLGANDRGIRLPEEVDKDHSFHFSSDVDGDGVYLGIAQHVYRDIVPAAAHHLTAVVPSMLAVGKPFEIQVRAEDEFINLATDFNETVTIRDENGGVVVESLKLRDGIATAQIQVAAQGPQRFRIAGAGLEGRSNPCRAFDTVPESRIYWGDIHGHTRISDGLGAGADEYFAFGRDVARLDVCALTDHGHFDWPQTKAAVRSFYEPGHFVTILAQEAGAGADHMNLYFKNDDTPHIDGWATKYDQFYGMVYTQYNQDSPTVAVGPHHFTYHRGDDRYPFGLWDDRTARFVEVYSSHGTSEYLGNPRPCPGAIDDDKFMQAGLAKGLRFGVIGSSDNHDSHPGRTTWGHYPGGLLAFRAPELTREAIWDALWNYHVYATSLDRIYVDFDIDGQPVGSDFTVTGPVRIRYDVIGKTDNLEVFLLRDNEEHRKQTTSNGVVEATFEDDPPKGGHFYYLRVVQDNGERAWSTPIWITRQ